MRSLSLVLLSLALPATARAEADPVAQHVDVGLQGAPVQPDHSGDWRLSGGLAAHAHLSPHLRLGLRSLWATRAEPFADDEYEGRVSSWHLDVRAEGHLRPLRTLDPWVGVGVGPYRATYHPPGIDSRAHSFTKDWPCQPGGACWGVAATLDLGADVHLGEQVSLGLFWSARLPFSPRRTAEDEAALYRLPSARLTVAF